MSTSRRALLQIGVFGFTGRLIAAEFWDQKPPAEWSAKDTDKLMTKSPWAKRASVDTGRGPAAFSGPATPRGDAPMGGGRSGGPQGGAGQMDDGGAGPGGGPGGGAAPEALVRWESARPILDAQKRELPEAFQGSYAISVTGFPLGGGPRPGGAPGGPGGAGPGAGGGFNLEGMRAAQQASFEKAKETTRLERKGKDPIHASVISQNGRALVILFPRGAQPIDLDDKEVTLVVQVGLPTMKVKFNLKDMVYKGKLEL